MTFANKQESIIRLVSKKNWNAEVVCLGNLKLVLLSTYLPLGSDETIICLANQ